VRSSIDVHNQLLADDVVHELSQLPGPLRDLSAAPSVLGLPPVAVARTTLLVHGADLIKATSAVVARISRQAN
jgi:hypothetical protein